MSEETQVVAPSSSLSAQRDAEMMRPSWLEVYQRRSEEVSESDEEEEAVREKKWGLGLSFTRRLNTLRREAKHLQYMFAVTSTLGGANHLCNRPDRALIMAKKQEEIGLRLNASSIIVRSRVFQAVNYAQMNDLKTANSLFRLAYLQATQTGDEGIVNFTTAVHAWLVKELAMASVALANTEVTES